MSVHLYRLNIARSKAAEKRNPPRCRCDHNSVPFTPLCRTKKLGTKRLKLARHGVVHLSTCQHSTLAESTKPLRIVSRDPYAGIPIIPTGVIRG